ncbi:MAG: class I SAM-dependent methyltransferase [Oscillospiraceae bacterium]|nr:class I SAM-dependent methyltransferase [Oscillospiraceae bacterium]
MLNSKGFDLWANSYDKSVTLSQTANTYPFAGYKDVLNEIYSQVKTKPTAKVLDIGFGTAVLSKKLYDDGYLIYGMDFSDQMIKIAKEKMPNSILLKHNFAFGIPQEFETVNFDFILCTYAIHHLDDLQKAAFIENLMTILSPKGKILIGDVAFETTAQLEKCKSDNEACWDNDEIYPVLENLKQKFSKVKFHKVSFCSGVFLFTKEV